MFPAPSPPPQDPQTGPPRATLAPRIVALLEVFLCSGFPTQLALAATLTSVGYRAYGPDGRLQIGFVVGLSLLDAVLLIGLILFFLRAQGERPRDVLLGPRPVRGEVAYGVPLAFVALAAGIGLLLAIQYLAPSLRSVPLNPLEALLSRPRDAWLFAVVVLVAGGVREEIQRAFLLHRFEIWLGGSRVGVAVTSVVFGAGHLIQGHDAAIVTGVLGAMWAVLYLRRRSVVAPIVSHAGFNLLQILQFVVTRR